MHVRARRVEVETRAGAAVQRARFRFAATLPDSRQNVALDAVQGRGSVRIVEQPRLENDYTASVMIEDLQDGLGFYRFALRWAVERGSFSQSAGGARERIAWSGRVEGEILVRCRVDRCESETVSGQPAGREKFRFTGKLPEREAEVALDYTTGRGDIRLIAQPSARNGYAAVVRIRDHPAGAGDYSFVLSWPRTGPEPARMFPANPSRSGRVFEMEGWELAQCNNM